MQSAATAFPGNDLPRPRFLEMMRRDRIISGKCVRGAVVAACIVPRKRGRSARCASIPRKRRRRESFKSCRLCGTSFLSKRQLDYGCIDLRALRFVKDSEASNVKASKEFKMKITHHSMVCGCKLSRNAPTSLVHWSSLLSQNGATEGQAAPLRMGRPPLSAQVSSIQYLSQS